MGRARRGRQGERGSALVEAAFITPLFFALIFGILEFGLLFRNSLTTNNAAQQGARAASVGGRSPDADYLILRSLEHGLAAMGLETLDHVVVFEATGPDTQVPAACLTASQTAVCNRYTAADFFKEIDDPSTGADTGNFRCGASSVDRFWCPSDRDSSLASADYVGVHVQTRHHFITGLFGDGRTLSETTIIRLEPDET
jgi:hypothetical protein